MHVYEPKPLMVTCKFVAKSFMRLCMLVANPLFLSCACLWPNPFLIICMFVAKLPYDTMHVYGQSLYDVMHVEAKPFLASCMF